MKLIDEKRIKEALDRAKELEDKPLLPDKELVANYRRTLAETKGLSKLLQPAWWISDTDEKKNTKQTRTRKKPTRKT